MRAWSCATGSKACRNRSRRPDRWRSCRPVCCASSATTSASPAEPTGTTWPKTSGRYAAVNEAGAEPSPTTATRHDPTTLRATATRAPPPRGRQAATGDPAPTRPGQRTCHQRTAEDDPQPRTRTPNPPAPSATRTPPNPTPPDQDQTFPAPTNFRSTHADDASLSPRIAQQSPSAAIRARRRASHRPAPGPVRTGSESALDRLVGWGTATRSGARASR